eukprot:TRINITY_DN29709_c0_g1_i1.p1 TRINITY_DN29709_c0_g1~~TRINITY_DN29709_c0_g1_i1.p1  ORF type:complete len:452 (-),score=99.22 TRINITY_DN29709_c0_g1_i1:1206-2561(-)
MMETKKEGLFSRKRDRVVDTLSCPSAHSVPPTSFIVDQFRCRKIEKGQIYFLSHFHSDHYQGIKKSFKDDVIFCSEGTARLVEDMFEISSEWIRPMKLEQEYTVYDVASSQLVRVTAIDANHCPSSVMFLFKFNTGKSILHTGDMRYDPNVMHHSSSLKGVVENLDDLFLDTTYCDEKYRFPPQELVFKHVDGIVKEFVSTTQSKNHTLVMVGSYSLGKEKLIQAVLHAWPGSLVYAAARRCKWWRKVEIPFLDRMTENPTKAGVHVVSMVDASPKGLSRYAEEMIASYNLLIDQFLIITPTGWAYSPKSPLGKSTSGSDWTRWSIPYSEHSNFLELQEFVQWLRPKRITPTVYRKRDSDHVWKILHKFKDVVALPNLTVSSECTLHPMGKWLRLSGVHETDLKEGKEKDTPPKLAKERKRRGFPGQKNTLLQYFSCSSSPPSSSSRSPSS